MFKMLGCICVVACLLLCIIWAGLELWDTIEKYVTRYQDLNSRVQECQKYVEIYQGKLEEAKKLPGYENTQKYHIYKSNCDEAAYKLACARRDLSSFWKRNRVEFVVLAAFTCTGVGGICGIIHCILNPK